MTQEDDVARRLVANSFPDTAVTAVEPFDGGETHEVTAVHFADRNSVVVKHTTDGTDRLRRDRAVLRYVDEATAVPVPDVLDWGEDPAYYVMELLSGETTPQLSDFESAGATDYLRTAGELLATLHEETGFDAVGHIEGTPDGCLQHDPAESWPAFFETLKRETASELTGTRFEEVASDAVESLPHAVGEFTVENPVLAHCDFGPNNVFRNGDDVTGIVDWEWTLAADPAYDLLRAERLFRTGPDDGTSETLLEGYRNVRPVPAEYDRRAEIYEAYETLSPMVSFDSWCPDDEKKASEWAGNLREAVYERLPKSD